VKLWWLSCAGPVEHALAVGREPGDHVGIGVPGEAPRNAARGRDDVQSTFPSYSPVKATIEPSGEKKGSVSRPAPLGKSVRLAASSAHEPQVAGEREDDARAAQRRLLEELGAGESAAGRGRGQDGEEPGGGSERSAKHGDGLQSAVG
jgi:hypothetical protein